MKELKIRGIEYGDDNAILSLLIGYADDPYGQQNAVIFYCVSGSVSSKMPLETIVRMTNGMRFKKYTSDMFETLESQLSPEVFTKLKLYLLKSNI